MCFKIKENARRWKILRVYKMVGIIQRGRWVKGDYRVKPAETTRWVSHRTNRFKYVKGEVAEAKGKRTMRKQHDGKYTVSGIYVCKSLRDAKHYAKAMYCGNATNCVIELRVRPKDLLHVADSEYDSDYRGCATYSRAVPTGKVFYPWGKQK